MIDWQKVVLNLRRHGSLETIARRVGSDGRHLRRLARGEVEQPRFNTGVRLLDLHLDLCGDRHGTRHIGAPGAGE